MLWSVRDQQEGSVQMLRRIVVMVSVVVTACVAVAPSIAAPPRLRARRGSTPPPSGDRRDRERDQERRRYAGHGGRDLGSQRGTLVKGYGTGDLTDPQSTIAIDDHVRIASVTKSFTATAILQLVAAKKLSLDAHLSEFVPDIANGDAITVAQLLGMTAGVFSYTEDDTFVTNYFADPQMPFTAQDALAIVRAHEPDFAPGTSAHYSDSNYVLLELIAEKVTGEPLGDTIQSQILDKVELDATSYPTTDAIPDPFSHGYLRSRWVAHAMSRSATPESRAAPAR